jgi:cytochrome c556
MKYLSRSLLMAGAALLGAATALPAAAQFAKPEDAIKYRKAAADNAEIATSMSKLPYVAFIEGTDKGDTKAEPKIWTEMDKFKAAASKMQEEMAKLNVVAKGGNIDAIKAQVGETGKSCKACHDAYRKE